MDTLLRDKFEQISTELRWYVDDVASILKLGSRGVSFQICLLDQGAEAPGLQGAWLAMVTYESIEQMLEI